MGHSGLHVTTLTPARPPNQTAPACLLLQAWNAIPIVVIQHLISEVHVEGSLGMSCGQRIHIILTLFLINRQ